jgi:hypothetical protein
MEYLFEFNGVFEMPGPNFIARKGKGKERKAIK